MNLNGRLDRESFAEPQRRPFFVAQTRLFEFRYESTACGGEWRERRPLMIFALSGLN
jgi:hypothetical protein